MNCYICNKKNATIALNILTEKENTEIYICNECMSKIFHGKIAELIGEISKRLNLSTDEIIEDYVCPKCSSTYDKYIENEKNSCDECKSIFSNINNYGGNSMNNSNINPEQLYKRSEEQRISFLDQLNNYFEENKTETSLKNKVALICELKIAVKNEDYSKAANIRDKIKSIEKRTKNK